MRMELDQTADTHEAAGEQPSSENLSSPPRDQPTQPIDPEAIPDSVRGAPEDLKPAIRKKQNKESARRSRRRRKELVMNLSHNIETLLQRTHDLENRLDSVEQFLARSGYEPLPQPSYNRGVSLPTTEAGPSHSGSIVVGSDGGSQSRAGSQSRGASQSGRNFERSPSDLDDEDVELLIATCLEQL